MGVKRWSPRNMLKIGRERSWVISEFSDVTVIYREEQFSVELGGGQ